MKHRLALEVLPLSKATFEISDHLNFTEQPIRYPAHSHMCTEYRRETLQRPGPTSSGDASIATFDRPWLGV
jgi:hypothetical protein